MYSYSVVLRVRIPPQKRGIKWVKCTQDHRISNREENNMKKSRTRTVNAEEMYNKVYGKVPGTKEELWSIIHERIDSTQNDNNEKEVLNDNNDKGV